MSMDYIETKNIKGLKDGRYALKPVTYVQGNNRSGKSAILQAIQQAVFGRSDEIGAKGAGALIRSGTSECSIECGSGDTKFLATVSVNKKGSISQSRSCQVGGMEVTEGEVKRLVGDVPCTIAGFKDLTGEEVWRLIMPSGDSSALPDSIADELRSLCYKLSECGIDSGGITAHIGGDTDCFSRATALLEAVNAKQREVREKARALITAIESPVEAYSGPPVGELKLEEKQLRDQVNRFMESHRQRSVTQQTLEYNRQQVDRHKRSMEDSNRNIEYAEVKMYNLRKAIEEVQQLLEILPDFIDSSSLNGCGYFGKEIESLIEAIRLLNPEHDICRLAKEFVDSLSGYITQNTYRKGDHPDLDQKIALADEAIEKACISGSAKSVTRSSYRECLAYMQLSLDSSGHTVTSLRALDEQRTATIQSLKEESLRLEESLAIAEDSTAIEAASLRLAEVVDLLNKAQAYRSCLSRAQEARSSSNKLKSIEPYFDSVIDLLLVYRVKALQEGIDAVTEKANAIIKRCELPPVVLEPVVGKRPSLVIKNELGCMLSAMSGAERLIYSSAIILAIQSVRNVVSPLLFLEGGELDAFYTEVFLLALSKHLKTNPGGNVFLAHWYKKSAHDLELGVINV